MAHRLPRPGGLGIKYRWGRGASMVKYSSHTQGRYVVLRAMVVLGLKCGESHMTYLARNTANRQWTEVIFKPLMLNAIKFLPAVNVNI
jgi:hypothetical protein